VEKRVIITEKDVEQKVQLDIAFVIKLAKRFAFQMQVLRQFCLWQKQQMQVNLMLYARLTAAEVINRKNGERNEKDCISFMSFFCYCIYLCQ
jgi:hypothetical protein